MRNFILVALTFHLLVIAVVGINGAVKKILLFLLLCSQYLVVKHFFYFQYTFGDIISFQRKCAKINKAYKHFAVYVGTKNLFGKTEDGIYCVFGSLANQGEHKKENYLDKKLTPSSQADIYKHIEVMKAEENCGKYNLLNNNCEHLATWVRYGKAFVKQVCDNNIVLLCLLITCAFPPFLLFTAWNQGRVFSQIVLWKEIT
uniref:LRAT domain-containing protein n=1 Tax=Pundamilia nyererei TaxID=303518 RepID=A0A3B4H8C1_9CICH